MLFWLSVPERASTERTHGYGNFFGQVKDNQTIFIVWASEQGDDASAYKALMGTGVQFTITGTLFQQNNTWQVGFPDRQQRAWSNGLAVQNFMVAFRLGVELACRLKSRANAEGDPYTVKSGLDDD